MKKEITLIFHVGFGKTATTWMQKEIFSKIALNEDNCIYFGKLGGYDGKFNAMMLDEEFHKVHYELFNSLNRSKRHRSRNSTRLVDRYAETISKKIYNKFNALDVSRVGNVVLSNETLAGYGGYNAELNMFLLKIVIDRVRKNLGEKYNLEEKILLTFREQTSLLQSYFAYDYYNISDKFKTFDEFIEYGLEFHHQDIFGSLWIDEVIQFMNDIFGKESMLFVPYELLKKNQKEFLRLTIVRLGLIPDKKIDRYLNLKKENVNQNKGNRGNLIRDKSSLQKIIENLTQYKRFIPSSMLGFVEKIYIAVSKRKKPAIRGEVVMTQKQKEQIRRLYRKSNTEAAKMISIDLGKLGYEVEG